MTYVKNFGSITLDEQAGTMTVIGTSEGLDPCAELTERHVAVQQGTRLVSGPAELGVKWATVNPLPANGFQAGAALAIGTEIYAIKDGLDPGNPTPNPGALSTTATLRWLQDVLIEKA